MRAASIVILAIIIASFAIGIWLYPGMPGRIASHWNAAGEVDGYMPKFWGLFLMPLISAGLALLFVAVPRIDPLKKNIDKFRAYYDGFIVAVVVFFLYIYLLTILWSLGYLFNMIQMLAPAMGGLFYCAGVLTGKAKRNWFIGIRTPWTLSSDRVWDRTHRLGAKLFKAAGVIAVFGAAFRDYAIWLVIVPAIAAAVYTIAYSYFEYQKVAG
jgi:uncharacterized membrane protein